MTRGYGIVVLVPLIFMAACQRDGGDNLRESYERMMASAERRVLVDTPAPVTADSPASQVPGAVDRPATLPIDTLPSTATPVPVEPVSPLDPDRVGTDDPPQVEQRQRPGIAPATLRAARTGPHSEYDRVVFEFDGDLPGYRIEQVNPPIRECGSGQMVSVAGQGLIRVRLEPAHAHEVVEGAARATIGNRNRTLDHSRLVQLVMTCDYEGRVEWVLGLRSSARYQAQELSNPARLVVDVLD